VTELAWQSAAELAAAIHDRRISARELMIATIERIDRLNPRLNAIVNPMPREAALELADTADAALAAGARIGPLHGLPIAIKDLTDATGFPTTLGFAPFAASLPLRDAPLVARLRAAGALVIGKTNTPEFGLGSHTFNALFGATANWPSILAGTPYSISRRRFPARDGSDAHSVANIPPHECPRMSRGRSDKLRCSMRLLSSLQKSSGTQNPLSPSFSGNRVELPQPSWS
jgi:amidase